MNFLRSDNPKEFDQRAHKELFRKAVRAETAHIETHVYKWFTEGVKKLGQWAANFQFRNGYKCEPKEFIMDETDFSRISGVGVVMDGKRHEDARGFFLGVLECNEELRNENKRIIEQRAELYAKVREIFKSEIDTEIWVAVHEED